MVIKGCYFHLSQIIYRRISQNKLAFQLIKDNNPLAWQCFRKMQMLTALPLKDLTAAIDIIEKEAPIEMISIVKWFRERYVEGKIVVDKKGCSKLKPPTFQPSIWNHHDTIQVLGYRTSNNAEIFHNRIGQMFQGKPSIWAVIRKLMQYSSESEKIVAKVLTGDLPKQTKLSAGTIKLLIEMRVTLNHDVSLAVTLQSLALKAANGSFSFVNMQYNKFYDQEQEEIDDEEEEDESPEEAEKIEMYLIEQSITTGGETFDTRDERYQSEEEFDLETDEELRVMMEELPDLNEILSGGF